MDRRKNPYAPGAGLQPPELAGRNQLIEKASIDLERAIERRPTKGMMLLGLRGVGKTVLLNRLLGVAIDLGFQTVKIEAPEGGALPSLILPELRRILYALDLKQAVGQKIRQAASVLRNFATAFKATVGEVEFGFDAAPGLADTGNLQQDLPTLLIAVAEAAAERKTAIGLFIDEVQYLSADELAALVVSCHQIAQRGLPLFFVGAGLPQIAALAGNAKSYAERLFNYPVVDKLDDIAANAALIKPALDQGVEFSHAAAQAIIEKTQGYPYFIQEWGSHVWDGSPNSPISLEDVDRVLPEIVAHLDASFFRVRFDQMTVLQQKYLRAMAELGFGPHKTGAIAETLGVKPQAVATIRQQLINKGMVWSQRHGETAFTVPMFDEFMRRQIPLMEKYIPKRRSAE